MTTDLLPTTSDAAKLFAPTFKTYTDRRASIDRANDALGTHLPYTPKTDWTPCALTASIERQLADLARAMPKGVDLKAAEMTVCERAVEFFKNQPAYLAIWRAQQPRKMH